MKKINKWGLSIHWRYILFAFLIGIVLPIILKLCHTPSVMIVLWLLIVFNVLASYTFGNLIKSNGLHFIFLFVFPILYLMGAFIILPHYSYYFTIVYLCVELLSYNLSNG
ncbi:hypothetical protein [Pediococcus pentosaceus]|uniref:hypothetical protein n=1 Tax=Pediococcus pentosaceus TaxID=1255 RepID=UPI00223BCCE8|nr:hypothetical protein [Pediococcus pentosaceus]MCT1176734.1 hypothetical protein [Pediococcus pentosaceus]